ncbi:MAG: glycosyltransferase [Candidatus Omnitrophica bacterium]|nr:glycosyltransferase [Candidatus Omnitrophota bacterium]
MKVAIIHDWLFTMRGGEKVLEHIAGLYPDADIYTLFYNKENLSPQLRKRNIYGSLLQRIPKIEKFYRYLLPIFPFLIERFNLSKYDLVISSSHCVAKGVRLRKDATHLCFCHTPMRYAWMFQKEYLHGKFYSSLALWFLKQIQRWDYKASKRVNYFAANSREVQNRIAKFYGRDSDVVYPPLDLVADTLSETPGNYFLIVSALVRYKRIDLAIAAFNDLGLPLKIIGTGECEKELKAMAKPNIEFLGWVDSTNLKRYYRESLALIFPGIEDFGITPLEAQAAGRPVIAFGEGGVKETVTSDTGVFFYEQTKEALKNAVLRFQEKSFDREKIRRHALSFNGDVFDDRFANWVEEKLNHAHGK